MKILINASVSRSRKKRLYLSLFALPFFWVNSPLCAQKSLIATGVFAAYEKQNIGIKDKPAFALWTQLSKKISLSYQWTKNHPFITAGAAALVLAPTAYYLYKKYAPGQPKKTETVVQDNVKTDQKTQEPVTAQNNQTHALISETVPAPHIPHNLSTIKIEELDNNGNPLPQNTNQIPRKSNSPNTSFDSLFQKLSKQYNQTSPTNPFQKNLFPQQKLNLSTLCNLSKDNNACHKLFDIFMTIRCGFYNQFHMNVKPIEIEKYKEVLKLPFFADPRLNLIIEILTKKNPALISEDDDQMNQVLKYSSLEERDRSSVTPFNMTRLLLFTALSFNFISLPKKFIQSKHQLEEVLEVINCMCWTYIQIRNIQIYDFLEYLLQSEYFDIPQHQDLFFEILSYLQAPLLLFKLALAKGCNPTTDETRYDVSVHLASENAETLAWGIEYKFINLWQPNRKGRLIIEGIRSSSQKALIKKKMFELRKSAPQKPFATHTLFLTFPRDGSTIDDPLLIDVYTILTKQFEPFVTTQNFLSHSIQEITNSKELDFEKFWTCRSLGYGWVLVLPRWLIKNDTPSQIPSYFSWGAWTPTEQELEVGLFVDHWPKLSGKDITKSFINKTFLATDKLIDKGLEYLNAPSGIKTFSAGFLHDPFQLSLFISPQPISVILNNTLIVPKSCYKNTPVPKWALFTDGHGDSPNSISPGGDAILSTSIESARNLLDWLNKNTETALIYISSCYSGSKKAQNLCGSKNYHFPLFFNTCFSIGTGSRLINTAELLKEKPNFWKMLSPFTTPASYSLGTIPFVKEPGNGPLQALPHKKIATLESSINNNKEPYVITYTARKNDKTVALPLLVALNTENITRPLILTEQNNYSHPSAKPTNRLDLIKDVSSVSLSVVLKVSEVSTGIPLFISTAPGDCAHTIEHLEIPQIRISDFVKSFTYLEENVDTKSYCFKKIYAIDDISNDQTQFNTKKTLKPHEKPYFSLFVKTHMEDISILLVLHSPSGIAAWDATKALDPSTLNTQWLNLTGEDL
ncbi:MAG: hypothetical protein UV38_C0001G0005 [candidate division TM6 bacterium GW2011_GWE2_42_60]|nr:MAG: hypothetical protein UV38_C0001G0005 [candidate division TM6 bacterium GW2011_GWE2_42_60]HBY05800.1 hypothetical protein [Candidatus Dependentiae bacterium]